jgi:hypothetical protein
VLGGGFGLWLGDNIAILSMVKRAHPLYSNRLWAHTIFGQSNRWKIDWEDLLKLQLQLQPVFAAATKP